METTFMCPHCKKDHMVRVVSLWAPENDNTILRFEIEDADFYDTESLNMQAQAKAQLEEEYKRVVDFVFDTYSGWCLRSEKGLD